MGGFESRDPNEFVKSFGNGYSATFVKTAQGITWSCIDSPQWVRGDESPEKIIGKHRLDQGLREAKAYFRIPRKK